MASNFVVYVVNTPRVGSSFELFTLQCLHTHETGQASHQAVKGPEELNFARVGGGRGRPDLAEGTGVRQFSLGSLERG
eukprot:scaffold3767_cov114-Isochrysis_galbana.AAC.1